MTDRSQAAVQKFKGLPIDKLNSLYSEESKAALLALRQKDRPAFEDLFDFWKNNGWRNGHNLKREVDALARQVGKAVGQLDPDVPMQSARRFRDEVHPTLIRFEDDWLVHRGSHYEVISADQVRSDVFVYLDEIGDFSPTSKSVSNVVDALGAVCLIERGAFVPPCWLDEGHDDYPADEILACRNGLLHIPSGELLPSTAQFFTRNGLPYDYDPDAPAPKRWLQFCADVWEHDPEQIGLLQEVFGYLLTPDTSLQKFFMILGPTRGGKGVITKTLSSLVGKRSVCSPKLGDLGQRFGLEPTLGKSLATVSDMRLGSRSDKQDIVGNILRIVGEDEVDVERKHIGGAWTGKLGIRIFIASNLMPPLPDVSGALIARLVTLTTKRSFAGEEDPSLGSALQAELPGILNWSLDGWKRLRANGRFTVTTESKAVAEKMSDLASPLNAFLRECCVLDPNAQTPRDEIWKAFELFVLTRDLPLVYTASNYFHRDLEVAAQHRITEFRPRVDGKQVKHWKGIRLLPQTYD